MSASPKTGPKQLRQPPPSLFLGPPSRNASHVSIPPVPPLPAANAASSTLSSPVASLQPRPLLRNRSNRAALGRSEERTELGIAPSSLRQGPRHQQQQQEDEVKRQADHAEELWLEMQRTLEGAELSAVRGTHVFGADHSNALEGLRTAQIALAEAWARSEADDAAPAPGAGDADAIVVPADQESTVASEDAPDNANKPAAPGQASEAADDMRGSKLEEETENDLLAARKRREANDRYFERVNAGVLEVVAKLDDVAVAMTAVKQESQDIWSEEDQATTAPANPS